VTVLSAPGLRDAVIRMRTGLRVPPEDVLEIFDGLGDLLDEVPVALDEIPNHVREIERARDEALREAANDMAAHEEKLEELQRDHEAALEEERQKRLGMEKDLDEWRRRAEKAEHDISAAVRNGHGIDAVAAKKLASAEEDLAVERARVIDRDRGVEELRAEIERLKDGATRLREHLRKELLEELARDADREALDLVERKHREIVDENRRLSVLLREMAQATPESALRAARIAVWRDVISPTGTLAEPAYRVRKRRKVNG
jgi:hypothetical protein